MLAAPVLLALTSAAFHVPARPLSRREAAIALTSLPFLSPPSPTYAATLMSGEDGRILAAKKQTAKVKVLRQAVRNGGAGALGRVQSDRIALLDSLQQNMAKSAPTLMYLTEAEYAEAQQQPLLLKGHLLELDAA